MHRPPPPPDSWPPASVPTGARLRGPDRVLRVLGLGTGTQAGAGSGIFQTLVLVRLFQALSEPPSVQPLGLNVPLLSSQARVKWETRCCPSLRTVPTHRMAWTEALDEVRIEVSFLGKSPSTEAGAGGGGLGDGGGWAEQHERCWEAGRALSFPVL